MNGRVPENKGVYLPSRLFEHIHHFLLKNVIHRFDGDSCARLRHGEHVDDLDRVLVYELAKHKPHDFHGYPGTAMLEHL